MTIPGRGTCDIEHAVLDMNGTLAADVVCANVRDALDLLLKPRRLAATLRA